MLDKLLKLWPLLTVASLAVVSVFNIGYFSIIGLHFIGVVDLTNIVYSVGLVFGIVIALLIGLLPNNFVAILQEFAAKPDAVRRLNRISTWVLVVFGSLFLIGLFVHRPYVSIMGLFVIYFVAAFLVAVAYAYVMWLHTGRMQTSTIVMLTVFFLFTIFWMRGWVADHHAFHSGTLYKVTTKDGEYDKVRLVRSSSSGFVISRDKQIIYLPAGEIKSIVLVSNL